MTWEAVPGFVEEREAHGETTVVVDAARLEDAARFARDQLGFNFLADVTPTDYLGWNRTRVAGYWGDARGRDINAPGSWGLQSQPASKPTRFSVSYHLLRLEPGAQEAPRLRLQVWVEDGEAVPSVVGVWPTADWHEREAWDLMGIPFEGHPNLVRIIMDDDWEGHPLRKDYPVGGEPVRFSGEE
ncbi:MAG TPA: NADH-quinone oxidoreductase subunit C [Gaiellaceae bacterium]|nr:NADH-quinone oxidoreductase subunit C [Gaiellaceae bacterium]